MSNELKALEDQFNSESARFFAQSNKVDMEMEALRSAGQRMFSIGTAILQAKSGKTRTGAQRETKSFKRVIKGLLACFMVSSCFAADYPVLVNTNMASNFGNLIVWRSFIEPEEMHLLGTNWSDPIVMLPETNGIVRVYQVANMMTNHLLKFTFEGKKYTSSISQDRGPVVGMREIPTPLSNPALQLRNRR
jgi:hypothetical protein